MATSEPADREAIGWLRAFLTAAVIVVVGFLGVAYLPDFMLNHLSSLKRDKRADVSLIVGVIFVIALAWGLRVAQRRRAI